MVSSMQTKAMKLIVLAVNLQLLAELATNL